MTIVDQLTSQAIWANRQLLMPEAIAAGCGTKINKKTLGSIQKQRPANLSIIGRKLSEREWKNSIYYKLPQEKQANEQKGNDHIASASSKSSHISEDLSSKSCREPISPPKTKNNLSRFTYSRKKSLTLMREMTGSPNKHKKIK